jgi:YVTN family beta-propeller protein
MHCRFFSSNKPAMKKLHQLVLLLLLISGTSLLTSCENEDNEPTLPPAVLSGIFVVNEGAFMQGNGSISFLSYDSNYYNNDLFKSANNLPLGDVVQSMCIYNRMGYICVNNSQKLEVVNMVDFKRTAKITIGSPRYFIGYSNRGYVSDWSDNTVKVIDLTSNTIFKTIPCGNGPEQMLGYSQSMFVCNGGGFSTDSTVTVIDVPSLNVKDTIITGVNPSSLVMDANNKLWVLCSGTTGPDYQPNTADDIGGKLMQIDPLTYTILKVFNFAQGDHPIKLTKDVSGQTLYWLHGSGGYTGSLRKLNINDTQLPTTNFINRDFYGLGIRTDNNDIYCGVPSFSQNSYMHHYTASGTLIDSLAVGIGPNGFVFY